MITAVDYHIIDRCNLNCAACNHFCSLVPSTDKGKSIEQITADLTLLSRFKDEIKYLNIMGGEPTLHPQLSKILRIARQLFPNNIINLATNGVLYNKFDRWKDSIIENKITVCLTIYPYCNEYYEHADIIKNILGPDVEIRCFDREEKFEQVFLSNNNIVPSEEEIRMCYRRDNCSQLKNGRLYICHFAAQFNRLKDYFGDKVTFDLDGNEYLDLNGDITTEDFYNFLCNSMPNICYHCVDAMKKNREDYKKPWGITQKNLNEWVVD